MRLRVQVIREVCQSEYTEVELNVASADQASSLVSESLTRYRDGQTARTDYEDQLDAEVSLALMQSSNGAVITSTDWKVEAVWEVK